MNQPAAPKKSSVICLYTLGSIQILVGGAATLFLAPLVLDDLERVSETRGAWGYFGSIILLIVLLLQVVHGVGILWRSPYFGRGLGNLIAALTCIFVVEAFADGVFDLGLISASYVLLLVVLLNFVCRGALVTRKRR